MLGLHEPNPSAEQAAAQRVAQGVQVELATGRVHAVDRGGFVLMLSDPAYSASPSTCGEDRICRWSVHLTARIHVKHPTGQFGPFDRQRPDDYNLWHANGRADPVVTANPPRHDAPSFHTGMQGYPPLSFVAPCGKSDSLTLEATDAATGSCKISTRITFACSRCQ